jgi:hypothetical protein
MEFVRKFTKPLCSDAFSKMGKHNYAEHCLDIVDAHIYFTNTGTLFFFKENNIFSVIPDLAKKMNTSHSPSNWISIVHKSGVNYRYLGIIRSLLTQHEPTRNVTIECVARVLKSHLK